MTRYWKTIIASVGLAGTVLTSLTPLWGDDVPDWVPVAIAVLTAVGVYLKANTPPAGVSDPGVSETDPQRGHVRVKPRNDPGYGAIELLVAVLVVVILVLLILRLA